ncbi:uncharacterized protein NPIL_113551 [Nephila pilipes]|uniref:Gustatory receptor n=1 Tax=Nephila pilipes TaxID=299642 RepID=A0A8X6QVF0_NEPPI|nr:uncharacterized protein NPIL_113551 [Nephila pilipes]
MNGKDCYISGPSEGCYPSWPLILKFNAYPFLFELSPDVESKSEEHIRNQNSVIKQINEEILCCPAETFGPSKRFEILKRKAKIDETLSTFEDIFSKPSFFILIANLFICFSTLFLYLSRNERKVTSLLYCEWAFYGLNSFGCLIIFLWVAGEIPINDRKFREIFFQKTQNRIFSTETPEELRMEKWSLDKPDFVLTGWDILSFRRSTVFAIFGTLITYTLLILSK